MNLAEQMHKLTLDSIAKLEAEAAAANAAAVDQAQTRIRQAAMGNPSTTPPTEPAFSVLLKPGGANSGFTVAQADYLEPYLEGNGFTVERQDVPVTPSTTDVALFISW